MQPANRGPLGLETEPRSLSLSVKRFEGGRPRLAPPRNPTRCGGYTPHTRKKHETEATQGAEGQPRAPGTKTNKRKTLNNGYLGSCNDEERSEMRYVV